jgi:hypothetical protein
MFYQEAEPDFIAMAMKGNMQIIIAIVTLGIYGPMVDVCPVMKSIPEQELMEMAIRGILRMVWGCAGALQIHTGMETNVNNKNCPMANFYMQSNGAH